MADNKLTFEEERWLMSHSGFGFVNQRYAVDHDIIDILMILNSDPDMYSYSWSCSKTPNDHLDSFIRFNNGSSKGHNHMWHYLSRRENECIPQYSSYMHIRVNESNSIAMGLLPQLDNLQDVSIIETCMKVPSKEPHEFYDSPLEHAKAIVEFVNILDNVPRVKSYYIITSMPEEIWSPKNLQLCQRFFERKYAEIKGVLERHIQIYTPNKRKFFLSVPAPLELESAQK